MSDIIKFNYGHDLEFDSTDAKSKSYLFQCMADGSRT